jgi:hypothetical protein
MSCPDPRKEVMAFKFGSCACVLMRKYVLLIASVIGFFTIYVHFAFAVVAPPVLRTPETHLSWEDFWVDCAAKAQSVNPVHTSVAFEKKYKDKTVTWAGKVNAYRMGLRIPFVGSPPMMLVEMDPPSTTPGHADLAVDIDPSVKERPHAGAFVQFVATITELGRRDLPTTLQAWEVKILDALPASGASPLVNRTADKRWHHHDTERDHDMQHVIEDVVKLGKSVHPQGKAAHRGYDARDASGITAKLKEAADRLIPSVAKTGAKGVGKDFLPDFDENIKRLAEHGKVHGKAAAANMKDIGTQMKGVAAAAKDAMKGVMKATANQTQVLAAQRNRQVQQALNKTTISKPDGGVSPQESSANMSVSPQVSSANKSAGVNVSSASLLS